MGSKHTWLALVLAFGGACAAPEDSLPAGGFVVPTQGRIVDLSYPVEETAEPWRNTRIVASGPLTALGASRLVAPLRVVDLREFLLAGQYAEVRVDDLLNDEDRHGAIEPGSLVVLRSGFGPRHPLREETPPCPGFSAAALSFLARERRVLAVGADSPWIGATRVLPRPASASAPDAPLTVPEGMAFALENLAGLADLPPRGSLAVIAPLRVNSPQGLVRVLAVAPRRGAP